MLYTEINIGGKDYKLRLDAKASVALERKLGKSPLDIILKMQENIMPKLEEIIIILHAALQKFHANTSIDDIYGLYETFLEEGKSYLDMIPIIIDIFSNSGYMPKEVKQEELKN